MTQAFACPACGAPLDYRGETSTVSCPYCFTTSQVPPGLRTESASAVAPSVMLSFMSQATRLRELANLVRVGQRQRAAELYQLIYKVDPATAAQAVNMLTGSGAVLVSTGPSTPVGGSTPAQASLPGPHYLDQLQPPVTTTYAPMTVTTTVTGQSHSGAGRMVLVAAASLLVCVIGLAVALSAAMFSVGGPVPDPGNSAVLTTAMIEVTRAQAAATEFSQAATQQARASATAEVFANASATAEALSQNATAIAEELNQGATATAEVQRQATVDAGLLAEAQSWPIFFQEAFADQSGRWETGRVDNEYYDGEGRLTNGIYQRTLEAKQNFASFSYLDPYQPVTDFYAAVDMQFAGSGAAAGLSFRHTDDGSTYAFLINSTGRYRFLGFMGSSTVSYSGQTDPLPEGFNRLVIVAQGTHFLVLLNDQIITTVDDFFINAGDIGLAVELANSGDSGTFDFDNFEIRTP